jgi:Xaa-Pro aminopeptidase
VAHPVPAEYRGIGIRIEDDVLITDDGGDILTAGTPKTIDEVEWTCAEAPRLPR